MNTTYKLFSKYSVNDVNTVEEFCKKYYKYDRFTGRGSDYMNCVIESNKNDLEEDGICFITKNDSITGGTVSFINEGGLIC